MKISSEQVKELKKRIDISYEEGEAYLKKARGDIEYAVFLIKKKRKSTWGNTKSEVKNIFDDFLMYKMLVTRHNEVLINLPVLYVLFVIFIISSKSMVFLIIIIGIGVMTECELKIVKKDKSYEDYNIIYKEPNKEYEETNSGELYPQKIEDLDIKEQEKIKENIINKMNINIVDKKKIINKNKETLNVNQSEEGYYEITIEEWYRLWKFKKY